MDAQHPKPAHKDLTVEPIISPTSDKGPTFSHNNPATGKLGQVAPAGSQKAKETAKKRTTPQIIRDVIYPHNIHPALVPGISVEEQKIKYGVDKPILATVGALIIAFVVWGVLAPAQVLETSTTALTWVMSNLGWIFTSLAAVSWCCYFSSLFLATEEYRWAWTVRKLSSRQRPGPLCSSVLGSVSALFSSAPMSP